LIPLIQLINQVLGTFVGPRAKSKIRENMAARQIKTSPIDTLGWPRLMSVQIAAQYLSLSPRTIYNGISKNAETPFPVKPKHYGKRVLFEKKDLDQWIDSLSQ
jgi:excisionase family DNA binding protein